MGKRELVTLLGSSSWRLVIVVWLSLIMPCFVCILCLWYFLIIPTYYFWFFSARVDRELLILRDRNVLSGEKYNVSEC